MKRIILMVIMITVQASYAQQKGIEFNNKKWSEVLFEAKRTNKLIFVDVFTDWCGPCKLMDEAVFPLTEVGSVYNKSFINYKIDAEKGEGPAFAKKYVIQSYPSYLFINGEGTLIYRTGGSMEASELIRHAKNAIDEAQQPLSLLDMEKLYPAHKKDKTFLLSYLLKLTRLKMNTSDLLDDYISMLSDTERSTYSTIQLLVDNGTWLNRKMQLGIAMTTLENNQGLFNDLAAKNLVHGETLSSIKDNAMTVTLRKAITEKNEALLRKVMALKEDFSKNMFDNKQTIALKFSYETRDYVRFKSENRTFINNYLLKIPLDTLLKHDQVFYEKMKKKIQSAADQKYNSKEYIDSYKHTQSIQLCNFLATTVENLLKIPLNKAESNEAVTWAGIAVQIAATDIDFYKNAAPFYQMVYAKALYKNGLKEKAITAITQLLDTNSENPKAKAILSELLDKMKMGEEV
ncbi:thioredoxin family protein [Pedobacter montanisoli]|uniref:Thioredoxin family protein n=1 Tax=Pedobacter montanisoli TaxID=2923277 RepID=A0ABS9ZUE0_9SPHI|nr:thioredoxin family protein [Pedobacter montanisoli]MCJ0742219.1 thioredoxin family protein [Pedobacter montanisoli]